MKTKEDCSGCYIRIKKYTPIRGFLYSLFIIVVLMIPIINIFFCKYQFDSWERFPEFWQNCWYDYIETRVRKQDNAQLKQSAQ